MKRGIVVGFILIIFIQFGSAYTYLNIYVDETGESLFLGETDDGPTLPEGVISENGIIKGTTQDLTSKEGEVWSFSYSSENTELYVVLPEGAVITNIDGGEIGLEGGQFSVYSQESVEIEYVIKPVSENYFYIGAATLVVAFLFFVYLNRKKFIPKKQDKAKFIENMLNDREKLIVDELKKSGEIKSSVLRKKCDIPKASFSRHIQELEKKKIISRSGEGKNKIISLR